MPKERTTFTLSPENLAYLEDLRKRVNARSTSQVLDRILERKRKQREKALYAAEVKAYYDSLPPEGEVEEKTWGEFGSSQLHPEMWGEEE